MGKGTMHAAELQLTHCEGCNKIVKLKPVLGELSKAPCCGHAGIQTVWPGMASRALLDVAFDADLETKQGEQIAAVFTCSFVESIFEAMLSSYLEEMKTPYLVASLLLEAKGGQKQKRDLYQELTTRKPTQVLAATDFKDWLIHFDELAKARNNLAHGKAPLFRVPVAGEKRLPLVERVQVVRDNALKALAYLWNEGLDALREAEKESIRLP